MARRLKAPSVPLALLAVVSLLSLVARSALLAEPCRAPCRTASDHALVFDEDYYVNAARVIAGVQPPQGVPYANAPAGTDPNSEHPQLAKLIMAGSIELFGDGPLAWRLGSVVFGSVAILGMFALVRAAGGGPWLALGAATLMATDNLLLVHSRIGTLDVYALAAMLWGAAFYLRGRFLAAGAVVGVGACMKLVAPYVLLVLLIYELLGLLATRGGAKARVMRFGACAVSAAGVFVVLLGLLGLVAPPYDPGAGKVIAAGPFGHIGHMFHYAALETSPHGPKGIASYPWQWLVDYKPITYLNVNPARPADGLVQIHPQAHFLGVISPPILALWLPGLLLALYSVVRRRPETRTDIPVLAIAWFFGTFTPFALLSLLLSRTSYLYYMVIVMPGIYIAVCELAARWAKHRWARLLVGAWIAAVAAAAIIMYPFTPPP